MARFPTPHAAVSMTYAEGPDEAEWIEGEPGDGPETVPAAAFPCFLFLPLGQEEPGPRSRKVSRPTVMWDPAEVTGDDPTADDELVIEAPEYAPVTGAAAARWQVEGSPQPFGPPGGPLVGVQATLKQVRA